MPNGEEITPDEQKKEKIRALNLNKTDEEVAPLTKRSTQGIAYDDLMEVYSTYEGEEENAPLSPIQAQRRKEAARAIIIVAVLTILLAGVIVLGIYAFK